MKTSAFVVSLSILAGACVSSHAELSLPAALAGKAVVLAPNDPNYPRAAVGSAVKPAGQGGISEALVIYMLEDIPVYRMWNGPNKLDSRGNTNRMGSWWSYDAPVGTVNQYRVNYEICKSWNDLTWMATCTLKKGAVVAIGPGQSVTAETCGDPTGKENYPANPRDWQLFVNSAWSRPAELFCPPDYKADPNDIAKPKAP